MDDMTEEEIADEVRDVVLALALMLAEKDLRELNEEPEPVWN